MSGSFRKQSKERGVPGLSETGILQPLGDPDDVEAARTDDMVEPSLGQADVVGSPSEARPAVANRKGWRIKACHHTAPKRGERE